MILLESLFILNQDAQSTEISSKNQAISPVELYLKPPIQAPLDVAFASVKKEKVFQPWDFQRRLHWKAVSQVEQYCPEHGWNT